MEPNQDIVTEPQARPQGRIARLRDVFMFGADWFEQVMEKCNNLTETNYRLACEHAAKGNVDNAVWRFRFTLWLAPDHVPSWYNLGCLYLHKGMQSEAMQCFAKVLRAQPTHEDALYMVSTMNPGALKPELRPKKVPVQMVIDMFDATSASYDAVQRARQYQLPGLLYQLLNPAMGPDAARHDLLDLGCGTGLCSIAFQQYFPNIIGVDISSGMIDKAYRRVDARGVRIFSRLVQRDLRPFVAEVKLDAFDLVLCMETFKYLGDLAGVFEGIAATLRRGGYAAVSFDPYPQPGFGMLPRTGYFGHELSYVLGLAQGAGLEIVRTGEVMAYPEQPVQLCFFRKPI